MSRICELRKSIAHRGVTKTLQQSVTGREAKTFSLVGSGSAVPITFTASTPCT
jgi:hypothetical protein